MDIKCLPIFLQVVYSYKKALYNFEGIPFFFEEVLFTNMKIPFEYITIFKNILMHF